MAIFRRKEPGQAWQTGTVEESPGGDSFPPDQWTVGDDGSLSIEQDGEIGVLLAVRSAYEADDFSEVLSVRNSLDEVFAVVSSGLVRMVLATADTPGLAITAMVARTANFVQLYDEGGVAVFRVDKSGNPVVVGTHSAPADGDIEAGECALWFDQTDGAAKLKIKGKSADGTVVQGEVALT